MALAFVALAVAAIVQGVLLERYAVKTRELVVQQHKLSAARVRERKRTDAQICRKVDRVDQTLLAVVGTGAPAPKPGWYGYDYWITHPQEKIGRPGSRTTAQKSEAATLAKLRLAACDPRNLTKGQGP